MSKYLYPIYKLKTKSYIRWWLYNYLGKFNNYVLSEILTGTSFYLEDSTDRKFNIFDIIGRTTQESTKGNNLISSENIDTTIARVTYKSQDDGTILANGTKYGANYANFSNNTVTLEEDTYSSRIFLLEGTISRDGSNVKPEIYLINQDDNTKSYNISEIGNPGKTKNIEAGTYFIRIATWSDNVVFTNAKIGIMLVKGSTIPAEFEKYTGGEPAPNPNYPMAIKNTGDNGSVNEKVSNSDGTQEQNISFPLAEGQKLMEGDYLADDGVHHKMGEVVFDGSDDESWNVSSGGTNGFVLIGQFDDIDINKNGYCNYFIYTPGIAWQGIGKCGVNQNKTFWCQMTSSMTLTEFKTWLSTHNLVVQYSLAEETTEDFTEEQKEAWEQIKNLKTYKPVTHISSEDETPAELKIQYWKEV